MIYLPSVMRSFGDCRTDSGSFEMIPTILPKPNLTYKHVRNPAFLKRLTFLRRTKSTVSRHPLFHRKPDCQNQHHASRHRHDENEDQLRVRHYLRDRHLSAHGMPCHQMSIYFHDPSNTSTIPLRHQSTCHDRYAFKSNSASSLNRPFQFTASCPAVIDTLDFNQVKQGDDCTQLPENNQITRCLSISRQSSRVCSRQHESHSIKPHHFIQNEQLSREEPIEDSAEIERHMISANSIDVFSRIETGDIRKSPPSVKRVSVASVTSGVNSSTHVCSECKRVVLNVSGLRFETWLTVLDNHPKTLLGNADKRQAFYDDATDEFFFDRHRPSFEAIFNYYQYGGRLKRPITVSDDIFLAELEFFELEPEALNLYKKNEGYINEAVILPDSRIKRQLWLWSEYPETSKTAFCFSAASLIFTLISIILFCIETLPQFKVTHCDGSKPNFLDPFFIIESVCTAWFTLEIIIRFYSCPNRCSFIKDLKNLIDIAAVLPYYVTLANVLTSMSCEGAKNSASLAFLRVIRLVRVFKLTKHSSGLQILVLTFRESVEGLSLFLVAFIVCILVFSSTIYYVEIDQPDSQIQSIPDAFWWAVITMCTVGYGDKVPRGPWGRIVGGVCAVAGVLTLAIPVPIITENFNKFYVHKTGRGRW